MHPHSRFLAHNFLTEIQEHPPSMLKNIDSEPLVGADGDPRAYNINIKKRRQQTPLAGATGDPGVSTINA
jgi:hypothetical protein